MSTSIVVNGGIFVTIHYDNEFKSFIINPQFIIMEKRILLIMALGILQFINVWCMPAMANEKAESPNHIRIIPDAEKIKYNKMIFGQFIEHFDNQVYGGLFDPGSKFSDSDGGGCKFAGNTDELTQVSDLTETGARWITSSALPVFDVNATGEDIALPVFRKVIELEKPVKQGILQTSALGIYDIYVNGARVEGHELKPGWTDYRKEVTYQSSDITSLLHEGENEIQIQLSLGWWSGGINRNAYGLSTPLALMGRLLVNGDCVLKTDSTWQCSHTGPLLLGDIYDGEIYDARRTLSDWENVSVLDSMAISVIPFEGPKVCIRDEKLWKHPESVVVYKDIIPTGTQFGRIDIDRRYGNEPFTLFPGETAVVDLGQNIVGWMRFEAKAGAGTEMKLRHGEMLNFNGDKAGRLDDGPGGSVWTYNLREAAAAVSYTFRGDTEGERYHPCHTFMGFRYVSITATDTVNISSLVGQVVGSDIEEWGEFECSDPHINQLYSNIWWSQRGNFLSVPTDCPQRDERLGWTGDTQIFSRTALYNSDAADFYRKWMRDMRNSQREDGAYPDIAPFANFWGFGTAAWGDAGVIVPWTVYEMTGDDTILAENYDSMTRWMDYLSTQQEKVVSNSNPADTLTYKYIGAGTATGDWLAYDPLESRYVSMAYYAYVAQLMDSISVALRKNKEALHYRQLYKDIRTEFQQRYMTPDGKLTQHTQTAYLLALRMGLLPEHSIGAVRKELRKKIEENDYCLSTGFVGTGILCSTLSDEGMNDLAYALLLQRKNPSWLYSVDQGATTIWERWDSYKLEEGFHKHHWNMNSFNHYAYGAVAEWMYAYMAGIQPGKPGFSHVVLSPHVDNRPDNHPTLTYQPRITWARAKTHTPYGDIQAAWEIMEDGHYKYSFRLPANVTYELCIPGLTENDIVLIDSY